MVGWSAAAAGMSTLLLCVPVNALSARVIKTLQAKQIKAKDERVRLTGEVLQGIKAIKLSAWEDSFAKKINDIRKVEVSAIKGTAKVWAVMNSIFNVCPAIVTLVTFATYVFADPDGNAVLTAEKAFACIAIIAVIRVPMHQFPQFVMDAVKSKVSLDRIDDFLNCEEIDDGAVSVDVSEEGNAVEMKSAELSWTKGSKPALKEVDFKAKRGELVAVLGEVGAGKSSLLSAILGEMILDSGSVRVAEGGISYVPQIAWIQNMSLRDNVLFGRELEEARYAATLNGCALEADLKALPAGDSTEIGENGVNLSGGQKQRVSLARAAYGDSDLILLDDPLSAVDAHVAERLFAGVIGPDGLLKRKTRILATHNLAFLPQMDRIVVLNEGRVVAEGTYEELSGQEGEANLDFLDFVKNASMHKSAEIEGSNEEDAIATDLEEVDHNDDDKRRLTSEEHTGRERVSSQHLCYFFQMMGWVSMTAILLAFAAGQTTSTMATIVLSKWSEKGADVVDHERTPAYYAAWFAALTAVTGFIDLCREYTMGRRYAEASRGIHDQVLSGVLSSPMTFFDSNPVGRVMNRFSSDLQTVDMDLPRLLSGCSWIIVMSIWTLGLVAYFVPVLIVGLILVVAVAVVTQLCFARTKRQLKRLQAVNLSPIFSHFSESVQGAAVVRAFGHEERFRRESDRRISRHLACRYVLDMSSKWLGLRMEYLGNAVLLMAAVGVVYFRQDIPAGMAAMVITYSIVLLEWIGLGIYLVSEIESDSISLERLREYANLVPEGKDRPAISHPKWPQDGTVAFLNYSTRYRDDLDDVLSDVSLEIRNGEKVGVCGRTGAGKSSLILAMLRVVESSSGKIELSGQDVSTVPLRQLRSAITVIPQDPVLFAGTVRSNVDPTSSHSDDEVWRALETARLSRAVSLLEGGMDHQVAEGGKNFSVGQRQLICLARALLRREQTRVLLLDEATAAMDTNTDAQVHSVISEHFAGCTVITVAHRLDTIVGSSDRVVVMAGGRVAEMGRPGELMQDSESKFRRMCVDAGLV